MTPSIRRFGAIGIALTVAACSGGDAKVVNPETPFNDRLDRTEALVGRIADLPGTAFDAMPDTGSASFRGVAGIGLDPVTGRDGDEIGILGDAVLTADFADGSVTGEVTNLQGAPDGEDRPEKSEVFDVDGTLRLGTVVSGIGRDSGLRSPNDFGTSVRGTVITPDNRYRLQGDVFGKFVGTRVGNPDTDIPMKGLVGEGGGTATDGAGTEGQFEMFVIGEQR